MEHDSSHGGLSEAEEEVEREIEEQAADEPPDPQTSREAVELDLMDDDESEVGGRVGEHIE